MTETSSIAAASSIIAVFMVGLSAYIGRSILLYWGSFRKKRKFANMAKKYPDIEILSACKDGIPVCVKYKEDKKTYTVIL